MNRKKMKMKIFFFLISFFSLTMISCGAKVDGYTLTNGVYQNDASVALVIILGNHANAMAIPQDAWHSIETMLEKTVYGGYACVIVADSTPTKVDLTVDADFFKEDARNASYLSKRLSERSKELTAQLKSMDLNADSPEVDLLAALREAKNVLSNTRLENIPDKQIVIVDSGISTAGDLNFVDIDFLYGKPDIPNIIDMLQSYEGVGVLPDLAGINVTFIGTEEGLAEVAAPQEISTTDKKFIKELWLQVVEACGAQNVQFESAAGWDTPNTYTEDAGSEFPYVSSITFFHEKVIELPDIATYESNEPDTQPNLPAPPVIEVKLSSETIGFKPDEAVYLNERNAISVLRPYAEELNDFFARYPDKKIWLVGTTAAVQRGADGSVKLGLQRAETVKNTLITELDIPEDKLLTIGLGARFPWFTEEYPNGSFDTVVAQANRAVWLLTQDSDKFESILSFYEKQELLPEAMSRFELLMSKIEE